MKLIHSRRDDTSFPSSRGLAYLHLSRDDTPAFSGAARPAIHITAKITEGHAP